MVDMRRQTQNTTNKQRTCQTDVVSSQDTAEVQATPCTYPARQTEEGTNCDRQPERQTLGQTNRRTADLESLVKPSILSRRRQVGDGVCIGAPLGDGGL